jgi:hypothetical protein
VVPPDVTHCMALMVRKRYVNELRKFGCGMVMSTLAERYMSHFDIAKTEFTPADNAHPIRAAQFGVERERQMDTDSTYRVSLVALLESPFLPRHTPGLFSIVYMDA